MANKIFDRVYKPDIFPLLVDLYQYTTVYTYWKQGIHNRKATFEYFFRRTPFDAPYVIFAGTELILEVAERMFNQTEESLAHLRALTNVNGTPMFEEEFLNWLKGQRNQLTIFSVPEGTMVFPKEPPLIVSGPLWQTQLIESVLLNLANISSLIATKTSMIAQAADGRGILSFGYRRAQDMVAIAGERAAFIGGARATSNVAAGYAINEMKVYPERGTHPHSLVMVYGDEEKAFQAYADSMPDNVVLLVDTYEPLEGVKAAIKIFKRMEEQGKKGIGIRLDSGDLIRLSRAARRMLDEADLKYISIYASNDLDENEIRRLIAGGARIDVFGVGTRLITGNPVGALGGVYKLTQIENERGQMEPRMKVSAGQVDKASLPGVHGIWRTLRNGRMAGDYITLTTNDGKRFQNTNQTAEQLLVVVMEDGVCYCGDTLQQMQQRAKQSIENFEERVADEYPVVIDHEVQRISDVIRDQHMIHVNVRNQVAEAKAEE